MCKHTHPKGEGKVKGRTGDKDSGLRNSPQSQQDTNSEEQVNSLRECVETLRSSQRDLRDTGKEVVSLRGPESRTGTAEAQPWQAGGQAGLWPGTCSSVLLPSPTPAWREQGSLWLPLSLLWFPGLLASFRGWSVRGSPFPLHQVLNLALRRDPPSQHLVLLPTG